jgi:hypothetical protein
MKKGTLIKVFAGQESSAILLKGKLSVIGVEAIIKNDSFDAYLGTSPSVVDLYIDQDDLEKAIPVLES